MQAASIVFKTGAYIMGINTELSLLTVHNGIFKNPDHTDVMSL